MMAPDSARKRYWTGWRIAGIATAVATVGLFAAANAHLIYVAVTSQPDCVPHVKTSKEGAATYRAADSAC